MASKKKVTTAVVAGVTALALVLGGTFAWTSISQQARNEAIVDINPGGRLHDDFNGTNKDVYVENFGDTETGVPIYARIRLDEYLEIGQDAGKKTVEDGTTRKATSIIDASADINDVATWTTYIPDVDTIDGTLSAGDVYWTWTLGNDSTDGRYYMPTFNKNKDSLKADINGTYEGTVEGDIVHYDDYVTYNADSSISADATYDWDDDTDEDYLTSTRDRSTPIDDVDVLLEEETHTAKQISTTATVMTMQQWINAGSQPGNYWVYDTDGWAYWANPIMPGETTGMLLDGITMSKVPDDSWYYGINVVGQFVTASDLSAFNMDGETMTPEAEDMLAQITNTETFALNGSDVIVAGEQEGYSVVRYVAGVEAGNQPSGFTWTAKDTDGNDITGVSIEDGVLTVEDTVETGTQIVVTATDGADITLSKTVTVLDALAMTITHDGSTYEYENVLENTQFFYVNNTESETVEIAVNRELDWDAIVSGDDYETLAKCGITAELVDSNTIRLTMSGAYFLYSSMDGNGYDVSCALFDIYTDVGEKFLFMLCENPTYDTGLTLSLVADDGTTTELSDSTVLKSGDQLKVSYTGNAGITVVPKYVYLYFNDLETGERLWDCTATASEDDDTLTLTVDESVTTEKSVKLRVAVQESTWVYNEYTVTIAPSDSSTTE